MYKIFIVGVECFDQIADQLNKLNDDLNICRKFSTDDNYQSSNDLNIKYINTKEIIIAHKNNAILYMNSGDYIDGVLIEDLYNSDILTLTINEFNLISDKIFNELDILVIFVDQTNNDNNKNVKLSDYSYFMERATSKQMIYFLNDSPQTIIDIIMSYILGDESKKNQILMEYS